MGFHNTALIGASGQGGDYNLESSLRFRESASADLSRTPTSAGNRKTWTWSAWVKLGTVNNTAALFMAYGGNSDTQYGGIFFEGSNLALNAYNYNIVKTVAEFRDPSAWYHVVVILDTTQATSSNRVKIYVNGVLQSVTTGTMPSQNTDLAINQSAPHALGSRSPFSSTLYFDGYMTEVNHVDGQALTADDFGETDTTTGVWKPKEYTGTYGTNGFYLPFTGEITPSVTAGFGGTAENVLYDDTAYLVTNTTTGSGFDLVEYDFGESINMIDYNIQDLRFTGGVSTFKIYTSDVGGSLSNYTERASLSVSSSYQNYSGNLGVTARYIKIRATAFGTNGQGEINYFNVDVNSSIFSDNSGNANNWTPNNINVVADMMNDVPTLTDEDTANFATLNPLTKGTSNLTLSDGNLTASGVASGSGSNWGTVFSSITIPSTGKFYVEGQAFIVTGIGNSSHLGILDSSSFVPSYNNIPYAYTTGEGFDGIYAALFSDYVQAYSDGVTSGSQATGLTATTIDVMLAFDVDAGKIWTGYNGTWLNSGDPVAGTGATATRNFSVNDVVAVGTAYNGSNDQGMKVNFGQRPFKYTPPAGYLKLNTYNLPDSNIVDGSQYFDAVTYTGDGLSTKTIDSFEFSPDLVWTKNRGSTYNHLLFDTIRGADKFLKSNETAAEGTTTYGNQFLSNGYEFNTASVAWNENGVGHVMWAWRGSDSSAVTNTDGTITSTVSANTTAGFSIVTYTGTAAVATVGHGLGVAPSMIITKNRDTTTDWWVYHAALGNTKYVPLNTTSVAVTSSTAWNNTSPTSTVFTLGGAGNPSNANQDVAYCFAEVEGFSKFGSYINNASTDGPFVYLGFRPAFVMIKYITSGASDWMIFDSARDPYNVIPDYLRSNLSNAETTKAGGWIDFISNGFKVRNTDATTASINFTGGTGTFIYMAFAETPFKNSLAR